MLPLLWPGEEQPLGAARQAKPARGPAHSATPSPRRAHLYLYGQSPEHDVKGGLLLRSNLHALFDRWLIVINPGAWWIRMAQELKQCPAWPR